MVEFDMYGIEVSLKECRDQLKTIRAQWLLRYPDQIIDVDFSRKQEEFFQTRDIKNRAQELDNQLLHLREISAMLYALGKYVEELEVLCKRSRNATRSQMDRIVMTAEQVKEADARAKIRFEEEVGRGKRKTHRR
jgi:hypothetical protein